jgi:23S rRNA (pseudouridine1915-N3)-methyltransferase
MISESNLIDQCVGHGCHRIVLDISGKLFSSEELSELITSLENKAVKKVSFIIGGPLGLADAQLKKADLVISLSRMTFTHDMVRLLVLEQLYRAYTIKAGEKYHK